MFSSSSMFFYPISSALKFRETTHEPSFLSLRKCQKYRCAAAVGGRKETGGFAHRKSSPECLPAELSFGGDFPVLSKAVRP